MVRVGYGEGKGRGMVRVGYGEGGPMGGMVRVRLRLAGKHGGSREGHCLRRVNSL